MQILAPIVMGMVLLGGIFGAASTFANTPAPSQIDQGNREIATTYGIYYLRTRAHREAIEVLKNHLLNDLNDMANWNLLGLVYLRVRDYQQASTSFKRAAISSEETKDQEDQVNLTGVYWYNYADALIRLKKIKEAKAGLRQAQKYKNVESSAESALGVLVAGRPLPKLVVEDVRSPWAGSVTFGLGYDTNVILSSDATRSSASATGASSPLVNLLLGLDYLNAGSSSQFGSSWSAFLAYHSASEAKEFNAVSGSWLLNWEAKRTRQHQFLMGIENQFDLSYLNTDGYEFYSWNDLINWKSSWWHGANAVTRIRLSPGYQKFAKDDSAEDANDRTGPLVQLEIEYDRLIRAFKREWTLTGGLELERVFAAGENYVANTAAVSAGLSFMTWQQITAGFGIEGERAFYPKSSNSRKDWVLTSKIQLLKALGKKTWTSLGYEWVRNVSNDETATYSKHSLIAYFGISL